MAGAANDGGMMPEQVWDGSPPTGQPGFEAGEGTFSATPLAWTHAQFVRLAWSIAGRPRRSSSRGRRLSLRARLLNPGRWEVVLQAAPS